jgi:hypothetical protein
VKACFSLMRALAIRPSLRQASVPVSVQGVHSSVTPSTMAESSTQNTMESSNA